MASTLGPLAMPAYRPSDFYTGSMAPPTAAGGRLIPTPLAPTGGQSSLLPYASGTIDNGKDQSQLPPGNPMQPNPALDAIGTATAPTRPWADLFRSLMTPASAYPPLRDGEETVPPSADVLTPNARLDPWAGMRAGGIARSTPPAAPRAARGRTVAPPSVPAPDPRGYIKAAPGMTTAQTHSALMAQQHNPQMVVNGHPVTAMNGQPARANNLLNSFGMPN